MEFAPQKRRGDVREAYSTKGLHRTRSPFAVANVRARMRNL
jgi:hypothetical protein